MKYRNTTAHNDMTGKALSHYLASIDVMDRGTEGEWMTLYYGDRVYLPNAGPIARWVAETIIDIELLGGANHPEAIY